jgi:hypothetical protein
MDLRVVDKILLRTSGRSRTRSFKELFHQYFLRPLMTPRLAAGACLGVLFLVLMLDLMIPKLSVTLSSFSPGSFFRLLDRGAQQLYGEGLRAYSKKTEWEDEFNRFKNNTINSLRSMMEQMDVPVEGRKKTEEPARPKENVPKEKRSHLLQMPA